MKPTPTQPRAFERARCRLARLLRAHGLCDCGLPARIYEGVSEFQHACPETGETRLLRDGYTFEMPAPHGDTPTLQREFAAETAVAQPAFAVHRLHGVHVRGKRMLLLPADRSGVLLASERSRGHLEYAQVKDCWRRYRREEKDATPRLLAFDRWAYNYYYHWMVDTLCRMLALDACPPQTRVLMPRKTRPYMARAVELLGIPGDRLECFDDQDWLLGTCWFAGRPYVNLKPSAAEVRQVRERLLQALGPDDGPATKLYVSRAHCGSRRLVNEEPLAAHLAGLGFERYFPEDHSLDEQISAFRRATAVVGSFGSGMTNIMFCAPGTPVVVLYDHTYFDPCIAILAACVGVTARGVGYDPEQPVAAERIARALADAGG